jgi:MoaA/NifB/PqqE/SkfB family radical SAM enzyme
LEYNALYIKLENIRELHVEITNNCNAACPMCARNVFGQGNRPGRGLSDWTIEEIHKVFDKAVLPNLRFVYFCGTHGDPLAARNVFEAIKAVKDLGAGIEMFTNGSLKTEKWWKDLVSILDERDRITFGVDGIETNHLYRQKTNIDKILKHMKICCDSKVKVRWDFLAFKHNEHEYEKCQQLAKEMGIDDFRLRRTARFDVFKTKFPVLNDRKEITHFLEPPDRKDLRHPSLEVMGEIANKLYGIQEEIELTNESIKQYFPPDRSNYKWVDKELPAKDYQINCIYQEARKLYVNSRMEVFPCCYISDEYENWKTLANGQLPYPVGELSLRDKTWKEILDHKFFKEELVKSWTADNVIPRCIRTCGVVKRESEQNVKVQL